jgi:hypothetical protein
MPAWSFQTAQANALALLLSYGHGIPNVDDSLPESEGSETIWLSPTTSADIAQPGQQREWLSRLERRQAQLDVYVDSAQINGVPAGATIDVAIMVNGSPTAIKVTIPTGATVGTAFQAAGALAVAPGDTVGAALVTSQAMDDASRIRCEVIARLV